MDPRGATDLAAVLGAVRRWANRRCDVRAVALVGSHARGSAGPGSDVDIVLLVDDPTRFASTRDWVAEVALGPLTGTRARGALTEYRIVCPSSLEVDVAVGAPAWASTEPVDPGTRRVVSDGMKPVHDAAGLLAALAQAVTGRPA